MSLRFITGRSGTGKTTFIEKEIAEQLVQAPLGDPIFILVPDQMSYSMEHSLSTKFGLNGLVRAQVVTFKRLAWRVLQETGGITREEIDSFGYRMLVRSVLEEHQDEFKVFRLVATKRGFTEQISDVMKEFSRYCIDPFSMSNLQQQFAEVNAPQTLIDKASDLQLLVTKIEAKLGETFVDSEGYLALLAKQIEHADFLQASTFYIDGFNYFTTRELEILEQLIRYTKRMTVVLPLDSDHNPVANNELFFNASMTKQKLVQFAQNDAVEVEQTVHLSETLRYKSSDLRHVEQQFERYPVVPATSEGEVKIIEATNRRAEIHSIAREIRALVESGKRYKEFAVFYRQPEQYDELFATIFTQYGIPYFVNEKKPMLHHPLIEFVRSTMEAIQKNWSYEAIFRAVKTDLFFPQQSSVEEWRLRADILENYVLSKGIFGKRWFDESYWKVKKYRGLELHTDVQTDKELALQQELHLIRDMIAEPLQKLENTFRKANTGQQFATALYEFAEQLHVYEKIIHLRMLEQQDGKLLAASEHEQAWTGWLHVLDQFVLMFGEKEMTIADAISLLDEGFDTLTFKRIPPALDQVTVMMIDYSAVMDMDTVFIVGANDGVLPARNDYEGLLSDADREWFAAVGSPLAPTTKMRLMEESYLAYRAFTAARERLIVSYSIADEEGKALLPSLYIGRLVQLFPNMTRQIAVSDPSELTSEEEQWTYIRHPKTVLPYLSMQWKAVDKPEQLLPIWQAVFAFYEKDPYWQEVFEKITRPLQFQAKNTRLSPTLTESLYGTSFVTSVSRVEAYYSCPFQHFATYGLQLEERSEFQLEAPAIGDLFHAALKWISDEVMRREKAWSDVTKEECWQLARQAVEAIAPYFFHRILLSNDRYRYIQRKLVHILQRTIFALTMQAHSSVFHPIAIEAAFGPGEDLPPLQIPLRSGKQMNLRGRIDRIDAAEVNGKNFLRVVDYKSSRRGLDLTELYYGLSLQMITYLDVALENAEDWLGYSMSPAGVLYMHIHNPMLRAQTELTDEQVESEVLKSYRMQGYILEDPSVALGMDAKVDEGSTIIPARLKKDGSFYATSKVLSPDDLQLLRKWSRKRHTQAGNAMLAGDTRVYPYVLKDEMPCRFCAYQAICQFDPTDSQATVRHYPIMKEAQLLERIREEVGEDEHTN